MTAPMLSVLIPASNEAALIGGCLAAIAGSDPIGREAEVIVIANGCHDATAARARHGTAALAAAGWDLRVIELAQGSKVAALNRGDAAARGALRVYLDADVTVSAPLLVQLCDALDRPGPRYASGTLRITGRGVVARAYARLWARVPFMARGVPGCGIFAVNAAGRARWDRFPDIIADDLFARLQFAPAERVAVAARYDWPVSEGIGALVRVRRRQDDGVREIARDFPELLRNDAPHRLGAAGLARLALGDPTGFAAYATVALGVRLGRGSRRTGWSRGR